MVVTTFIVSGGGVSKGIQGCFVASVDGSSNLGKGYPSNANGLSSSCLAHQVEGTGNNPGYFSVVSRPGRRSKKWFRSFCEPADIRNNFESAKCFVEGGEDNSFGKSCYVASGSLWGGFQ